jgi:hypothetical protein
MNGTLVKSTDDWKESQQNEIEATGIPPADDRESAILMTWNQAATPLLFAAKMTPSA